MLEAELTPSGSDEAELTLSGSDGQHNLPSGMAKLCILMSRPAPIILRQARRIKPRLLAIAEQTA